MPEFEPDRSSSPITVGALARAVAGLLERGFPPLWVVGEISNLARAASGHWYFVLKDAEAQVRCVMFRNRNLVLDWMPRDGDRVEARALVGLYAPRGEFQLQVEQMRRSGAGALFEAFLRIKARCEAAGLFDPARKRPVPAHPRVIGVVTSLQAAALRDVLTALARRAPHVAVLVFPTPVQGDEAPAAIVRAIVRASEASTTHGVDVILLVRGGGSIEDLWAYNDESVARAIAGSAVPVVSGVGHETDFTIADFVADLRAPTPTAAAELASPDADGLRRRLLIAGGALDRSLQRFVNQRMQRVDEAARRLRSPAQRLLSARQALDASNRRLIRAHAQTILDAGRRLLATRARLGAAAPMLGLATVRSRHLHERLEAAMRRRIEAGSTRVRAANQHLVLLDPRGILARGYAIATDEEGDVIRDAFAVRPGQPIKVEVARGRFAAVVAVPPDAASTEGV